MKHHYFAAFTWCVVAGLAFADSTPQKKAAAPSHKTTARKTSATVKPATRTAPSKSRYATYRRPVRRPTQQISPTPERYREIQDALAARGYLKTPATGVWDKDSVDAMQRFQQDQKLEPTGKLTARSLGALGLGPKPPETTLLPPNPVPSLSANPASDGASPQ